MPNRDAIAPGPASIMKRKDWDKLAATFETDVCDISREEMGAQVPRYLALAKLPKRGAVVADLGCGIGTFIRDHGDRFAEIFGVEFAPKIIARAKQRCAGMKNVTWLTLDLPQAAKKIGRRADLTVCMNVITQANAARRRAMWESVAKVTNKGGYALVVVASLESEKMIAKLLGEELPSANGLVDHDGALQKHYAREELVGEFERAGFAVIKIGKAHYPWRKEGLRETARRRANRPWDWIALAKRV